MDKYEEKLRSGDVDIWPYTTQSLMTLMAVHVKKTAANIFPRCPATVWSHKMSGCSSLGICAECISPSRDVISHQFKIKENASFSLQNRSAWPVYKFQKSLTFRLIAIEKHSATRELMHVFSNGVAGLTRITALRDSPVNASTAPDNEL